MLCFAWCPSCSSADPVGSATAKSVLVIASPATDDSRTIPVQLRCWRRPGRCNPGRVASTETDRTVGELLRTSRRAAGLSQEELAERAGLSVEASSAIERGVRRRPPPHTLRALASALALSAAERAALFGVATTEPAWPATEPVQELASLLLTAPQVRHSLPADT